MTDCFGSPKPSVFRLAVWILTDDVGSSNAFGNIPSLFSILAGASPEGSRENSKKTGRFRLFLNNYKYWNS